MDKPTNLFTEDNFDNYHYENSLKISPILDTRRKSIPESHSLGFKQKAVVQ
jgi:hypothetical protein